MKVLFVIGSLSGAGGAERVMTIMADYWIEKGWAVTIVTLDDGIDPPFYRLNPDVNLASLNQGRKKDSVFLRIMNYSNIYFKIRRLLVKEKPDYIIPFTSSTSIKVLRAMLWTNIPIIVSERNIQTKSSRSYLLKIFRNLLYLKAKCIVCQTRAMMDCFPPPIRRKSVVIPNPVPEVHAHNLQTEIALPEGKLLFTVGHLSQKKMHQKGLDLLMPVFKNLSEKHPDWCLIILNDGPERAVLEREIEQIGLHNRVYLPGRVNDVFPVFKKGDLFVLSSRYEGFPNALCEAMACGLPVVSFDCPSGPGDIIRHGIDGFLVPPEDQEGMEIALDELMSSETLRKTMGQRAAEVVERFSVDNIMGVWDKLID